MKKNRQSVIRDDTQIFNNKIKDKTKSRIFDVNEDEMKEEKEDMKEDSFNSNFLHTQKEHRNATSTIAKNSPSIYSQLFGMHQYILTKMV